MYPGIFSVTVEVDESWPSSKGEPTKVFSRIKELCEDGMQRNNRYTGPSVDGAVEIELYHGKMTHVNLAPQKKERPVLFSVQKLKGP